MSALRLLLSPTLACCLPTARLFSLPPLSLASLYLALSLPPLSASSLCLPAGSVHAPRCVPWPLGTSPAVPAGPWSNLPSHLSPSPHIPHFASPHLSPSPPPPSPLTLTAHPLTPHPRPSPLTPHFPPPPFDPLTSHPSPPTPPSHPGRGHTREGRDALGGATPGLADSEEERQVDAMVCARTLYPVPCTLSGK